MGLAILFNVAVADGPISAFKWFSRRVHKYIDWAIIVSALVASAILDLDVQARLVLLAVGLVMAIIVLGTNYGIEGDVLAGLAHPAWLFLGRLSCASHMSVALTKVTAT